MTRLKWITSLSFFISLVTAFRDGDVRLTDSNRYGEGRVEVLYRGTWGTVCQAGWDFAEAQVVCRQLGFPNGAQIAFGQARFGQGSGPVLLSDVDCEGDEETITECNNVIWNNNTCTHETDVGVRCNAPNFEGCFPSDELPPAIISTVSDTLTIESCYAFCQNYAPRYFWMEGGNRCSCGTSIQGAVAQQDGCHSSCTGDEDWICGGSVRSSVYSVRVELPYAGSHGFPGIATGVSRGDSWRFVPEIGYDYLYARVHQFDIPSTNVEDLVDNPASFEVVDGTAGVFLVSSSLDEITVSYRGKNNSDDDFPGFLFEFGQGTFCTAPPPIPNGIISTTGISPITVGDSFRVTCSPGFIPIDGEIFCQDDGELNREVGCMPSAQPTEAPEDVPPTMAPDTTSKRPEVMTLQGNTGTISVLQRCQVPVVENGKVNATPSRQALDHGAVIEITCNPIFEPVNTTAVCQEDGKFAPTPKCQRNETMFIILLVAVGVVGLLIIILLVLLVGCACYFSMRKKRRVRSYERRNKIAVTSSTNAGFEMSDPVPEMEDDSDIIDELPDADVASRVFAPNGGAGDGAAATPVSLGIGEEEANVLQGLNDVVDGLERDGLYRSVVKPSIVPSGGFGGHFAR